MAVVLVVEGGFQHPLPAGHDAAGLDDFGGLGQRDRAVFGVRERLHEVRRVVRRRLHLRGQVVVVSDEVLGPVLDPLRELGRDGLGAVDLVLADRDARHVGARKLDDAAHRAADAHAEVRHAHVFFEPHGEHEVLLPVRHGPLERPVGPQRRHVERVAPAVLEKVRDEREVPLRRRRVVLLVVLRLRRGVPVRRALVVRVVPREDLLGRHGLLLGAELARKSHISEIVSARGHEAGANCALHCQPYPLLR
mmetsp:Transcript_19225/g.59169  ORF Transcript_19225/g.59169 Transcript_19225/m.59169 type:complete len:250 (+) Transcript_19225:647-1396(+)